MSVDREIEHTSDIDVETDEIATLSEEQTNLVQMQQLAQQTVEPGVMRLNCSDVSTSKNRTVWAITVEHPVEGEHTVFIDKPVTGWSKDCELSTVLRWYGIHDQDPYKLQCHYLTLEYDEQKADDAHGWRLVEPPSYESPPPTRKERIKERLPEKPSRTVATVYTMLLAGALVGPTLASMVVSGVIGTFIISAVSFVFATTLAIAATDPEKVKS